MYSANSKCWGTIKVCFWPCCCNHTASAGRWHNTNGEKPTMACSILHIHAWPLCTLHNYTVCIHNIKCGTEWLKHTELQPGGGWREQQHQSCCLVCGPPLLAQCHFFQFRRCKLACERGGYYICGVGVPSIPQQLKTSHKWTVQRNVSTDLWDQSVTVWIPLLASLHRESLFNLSNVSEMSARSNIVWAYVNLNTILNCATFLEL